MIMTDFRLMLVFNVYAPIIQIEAAPKETTSL